MQVSIETTSGLERRLTIGVPAEDIENEVTSRLQKATKTVRIAGFRPGKVPFKVIRQRYGAGVRQEVVGEVMSRSFYEAVTEQQVQPAGQPSIEPLKNEPGQDLEFVATFEIYPEIELQDLSAVTIERPVAEIKDSDVDAMIQNIRKQRSTWETVERAAAAGDKVNIDYVGSHNGEPFEGGQADAADLELGSGQMIPGFEDGVIGMSAEEERTLDLTFPEDYHNAELRGAAVQFVVKVNTVSENKLPELNDELFEQFGVKEGGEDKFREDVRQNMQRELDQTINNKVKARAFSALSELHDFDVPEALVSSEIAAMREQMLGQFGNLQNQNIDMSIFPDDLFAGEAKQRVKLGLLVAQVVKTAALEVDSERVKARVEEAAASYEQPEQVLQYYYGNEQALQGIQSAVLEEQVVEHLLASAKVDDQVVSYDEARLPDPPKDDADADTATTA